MYNSFYRTTITDNEMRKFLDTFVGPTTSLASMLRIFRNGSFSLATRIGLDIFIPLTRARALYLLQNFSFTLLKNTVFNEFYLHQRIWRHIFENGCSIIGSSTYFAVFRLRQAYLAQLEGLTVDSSDAHQPVYNNSDKNLIINSFKEENQESFNPAFDYYDENTYQDSVYDHKAENFADSFYTNTIKNTYLDTINNI
jgi:hypothetical protein